MTAVSRRDSDSFSDLDQPDTPVFMIKNRAIERGDYASGLQFFVANCSAFSGTSKGFKDVVVKCFEQRTLELGEAIAMEGSGINWLTIILHGSVIVSRSGQQVGTYKAGGWYGEWSLLEPRESRVSLVNTDGSTVVAMLSGDAFSKVLSSRPEDLAVVRGNLERWERLLGVVENLWILAGIDPSFSEKLAAAMESVAIEPERVLYREGDLAEDMYVVEEGVVELMSAESSTAGATLGVTGSAGTPRSPRPGFGAGSERSPVALARRASSSRFRGGFFATSAVLPAGLTVVSELGSGSVLGEVGLVKKTNRNASARTPAAGSGARLARLPKAAFEHISGMYPEAADQMRENITKKQRDRAPSMLPLHMAVRTNRIADVDQLLSLSKKKGPAAMIALRDEGGWTAIHEAAHGDCVDVLEHLHKLGGLLDVKTLEGDTPLHLAAVNKAAGACLYLLEKGGVDPEVWNEDGSTALHLAARVGAEEVVKVLVSHGAQVDAVDLVGNRPLHLACNCGNAEAVKELVDHGADVLSRRDDGAQPLHMAALGGSGVCCRILLDRGAQSHIDSGDKEGASPLQYSANAGAAESCQVLCERGANPNSNDINGHIPLHHAAYKGSMPCVMIMLNHGASKRAKGQDGLAPFMFARIGQHPEEEKVLLFEEIALVVAARNRDYDECVRLLGEGKSPNEHEEDGWTPVHEAAAKGFEEILELFHAHQGDLNAKDEESETPLGVAAGGGHLEAVKYLLANGARESINVFNSQGQIPLHLALKGGHWEVAKLLMTFGGDLDRRDEFGNNARDLVKKAGGDDALYDEIAAVHPDMMSLHKAARAQDMDALNSVLERRGFDDPDALDEGGWTALRICAANGWVEGARRLIEAGASPHLAEAHTGDTPLHMAGAQGSPDMVRLLLQAGASRDETSRAGKYPYDHAKAAGHAEAARLLSRDSLLAAAARGDAAAVRELLAAGANPNESDPDTGRTAAHLAALGNFPEVIVALAEASPAGTWDPDARDLSHDAALHLAALRGHVEAVEALVHKAGADKDVRHKVTKQTPLHLAGAGEEAGDGGGDHGAVAKVLLAADADAEAMDAKGRRPVHLAAAAGSERVIRELLAHNARTDEPDTEAHEIPFDAAIRCRRRGAAILLHDDDLLFRAAAAGDVERIGVLVDHGCNVSARDEIGSTPLHHAARNGRVEAAKELLTRGARADDADDTGETSLHVVAAAGSEELTAVLLGQGAAEVTARDGRGLTPLHVASAAGHAGVVKQLLDGGAPPDGLANDGRAALHMAVDKDKPNVVAALLSGGATKKLPAPDGRTPFQHAEAQGFEKCAKLLADTGGIHAAARDGDLAKIKDLLKYGADVNELDPEGATALHHAARGGQAAAAQLLLEKGANAHTSEPERGYTALHEAAALGKADVARVLMPKSDVAARDSGGRAALHLASRLKDASTAKALLGSPQGAALLNAADGESRTPLLVAAHADSPEVVGALLKAGADKSLAGKDARTPFRVADEAGHGECARLLADLTGLHEAAERGDLAKVRELLKYGAKPDELNAAGETALHCAARAGQADAAMVLVDEGRATVDAHGPGGRTPLHFAAADANHVDTSRALLARKADPRAADSHGRTPLHVACAAPAGLSLQVTKDAVACLVDAGAELNARDGKGRTALREAAEVGKTLAVALLLERGADKRIVAEDALSPYQAAKAGGHREAEALLADKGGLHAAAAAGDLEKIKELLRYGADVNEADSLGTPLHYAARAGQTAAAALLLDSKAEVDATRGAPHARTSLHEAAERGHEDTVALLLRRGADPAARDAQGRTALHLAAVNTFHASVSALIASPSHAKGTVDLQVRGSDETALHQAVRGDGQYSKQNAAKADQLATLRALLVDGRADRAVKEAEGQNPYELALELVRPEAAALLGGAEALVKAAALGRDAEIKILLDGKLPAGSLAHGPASGKPARTALMEACFAGHDTTVALLLRRGAEPNTADADGLTALHEAARGGHAACVEAVAGSPGAHVDPLDKAARRTPLHLASAQAKGDGAAVKALLKRGAAPDLQDKDGATALHLAALADHPEAIKALLAGRADKRVKQNDGAVPYAVAVKRGHAECAALLADANALHQACLAGDADTVSDLLAMGSDPNEPDAPSTQAPPLHYALRGKHAKVAGLVMDKGALPDGHDSQGTTGLHISARLNDLPSIEALLARGAPAARADKAGMTPLHRAAEAGAAEAVARLAREGHVNTRDGAGRAALHLAVAAAAADPKAHAVRALLAAGADRSVTNREGLTPFRAAVELQNFEAAAALCAPEDLVGAAERGEVGLVTRLVDAGVDPNARAESMGGRTALHAAAAGGHAQLVAALLDKAAKPQSADNDGATALHLAAARGHDEVMKALLAKGALPGARDRRGRTPLHEAARCPKTARPVELLLERGAGPDDADLAGGTALHEAADANTPLAVQALLAGKANKRLADAQGRTPYAVAVALAHDRCAALLADRHALHAAAARGDVDEIEQLLGLGAEVDERDPDGRTPLHHAARNGHVAASSTLLAAGADIDAAEGSTTSGLTSLHHAASRGDAALAELLLAQGALGKRPRGKAGPAKTETRAAGEGRETALMLAAAGGHAAVVKALLSAGADASALDGARGETPLHKAARAGSEACVSALLKDKRGLGTRSQPATAGSGERPFDAAMQGKHYGCAVLLADIEELIRAAGAGNLALVEHLLDGGMNVNGVSQKLPRASQSTKADAAATALHAAAAAGHAEVIALLLRRGADPTVKAPTDGSSLPLHLAAAGGHDAAVEMLVRNETYSGYVDTEDGKGRTALHLAARSGSGPATAALLKAGASKDVVDSGARQWTALHYAADANGVRAIEALLAVGASRDALCGGEGRTPYETAVTKGNKEAASLLADRFALHRAAAAGDVATVTLLLDMGVDANLQRDDGATALCVGAANGRTEVLDLLIRRGGDPSRADARGDTPLHFACHVGHVPCTERLLREGARVNPSQVNTSGGTALHSAASGLAPSEYSIDLVVKSKPAVLGARDNNQRTALHAAGLSGNLHAVRALLAAGASRADTDTAGQRPYDLALSSGHLEAAGLLADPEALIAAAARGDAAAIEELLGLGVAVNSYSAAGETALVAACRGGHLGAVAALLRAPGVEVGAVTRGGPDKRTTALHVASALGSDAIVKALLAAATSGPAPLPSSTASSAALLRATSRKIATSSAASLAGGAAAAVVEIQDAQGNTPLHAGVAHPRVLEALLAAKPPVNRPNAAGETALFLAAQRGAVAPVKALLAAGADRTLGDASGVTPHAVAVRGGHQEAAVLLAGADPLVTAAGAGDLARVQTLLLAGADPNGVGSNGDTPIVAAARGCHDKVLAALIAAGAHVDGRLSSAFPLTPLHLVAGFGDAAAAGRSATVLMGAGADPNAADKSGRTPLHLASAPGVITALVSGNPANPGDVNRPDGSGRTPLHHAVARNSPQAVAALLSHRAEKMPRSGAGQTPYDEAVALGHSECANLLLPSDALIVAASRNDTVQIASILDLGADKNAKDPAGATALHHAARHHHVEAALLLVERGCDVDTADHGGATPVMEGLASAPILARLLAKRPNLAKANAEGRAALHLAAMGGFADAVDKLMEAGAKANTGDLAGDTPLHLAAKWGHASAVRAVLRAAGGPEAVAALKASRNKLGLSPYDVAVEAGQAECAALLGGVDVLVQAAKDGDLATVTSIVQLGTPVNARSTGPEAQTALHAAARAGRTKVVAFLLSHGADPRQVDARGRVPAHSAVEVPADAGHAKHAQHAKEVMTALLNAAPDSAGIRDVDGVTAAHVAAGSAHAEALERVLAAHPGAPEERDALGRTPLHWGGSGGAKACVELLLERGARRGDKDAAGALPYDLAVRGDHAETAALLAGPEILNRAAAAGDVERINRLIADGVSVRALDGLGRSALHYAAEGGHEAAIAVLLKARADPAVADATGVTPLHLAAAHGEVEAIAALLAGLPRKELDALVGAQDSRGLAAVHYAARDNRAPAIAALAGSWGANISKPDRAGLTPLHWTAQEGSVSATRELLNLKADPGVKTVAGESAYAMAVRCGKLDVAALLVGNFALHRAARAGDADLIHELVSAGADMEQRDESGDTPLLAAARVASNAATSALVSRGADASAADALGHTALHLAAKSGNLELSRALLRASPSPRAATAAPSSVVVAVVDPKDLEGRTPLHLAVAGNHSEVILELLAAKADPNQANSAGNLPVHVAASRGHVEAIKALRTDPRADFLATNASGKLAYDVAVEKQHKRAAEILPYRGMVIAAAKEGDAAKVSALLARGEDAREVDDSGMTALHYAAARNFGVVVNVLLSGGADPNAVELEKSRSPLHLASAKAGPDVLRALLDAGARVNLADGNGARAPLHYAAAAGNLAACKVLIKAQAALGAVGVELATDEGVTPSMMAAAGGHLAVYNFLAAHGAKWRTEDKAGQNAYDHAFAAGKKDVVAALSGVEVLKALVRDKDSNRLNQLIQNGADPNGRDASGRTPVHLAMELDHAAQVEDLALRLGDFALVDALGWTPLHVAAGARANNAIRVALDGPKASRKARAKDGRIPYDIAVAKGYGDTAALLAVSNELMDACAVGDTEWIKRVLEAASTRADKVANKAARNERGLNALAMVLEKGNLKAAQVLLAHDFDFMEVLPATGGTALEHAKSANPALDLSPLLHNRVRANDVSGVDHLLALGANIEHKDKDDLTPAHLAARLGFDRPLGHLLLQGAQVNIADLDTKTPLIDASRSGNVVAVRALVQAGARVKVPDAHGRTPLHYAAANADEASVRYLLENGADHRAKDESGQRPEHVCPNTSKGVRTRKLLMEWEARLNAEAAGVSPRAPGGGAAEGDSRRPVSPGLLRYKMVDGKSKKKQRNAGESSGSVEASSSASPKRKRHPPASPAAASPRSTSSPRKPPKVPSLPLPSRASVGGAVEGASSETPDYDAYWESIKTSPRKGAAGEAASPGGGARPSPGRLRGIVQSARAFTSSSASSYLGPNGVQGTARAPKWVPSGNYQVPLRDAYDQHSTKLTPIFRAHTT